MSRSPVPALASSVALVLMVASCGGDASEDDPPESKEPSSSAASSPGPRASVDPLAAASEVSSAEFGEVLRNALSQVTTADLDFGVEVLRESVSGEGQVDLGAEPASAAMTMYLGGEEVEVILADDVFYLRDPDGGKYLEYRLDGSRSSLSSLRDQVLLVPSLAGFESSVTRVLADERELEGEPMQHFTTTVDADKVLPGLRELPASRQPDAVDYQWWFDQDGNLRQVSAELGETIGSLRYTFGEWGRDVDIAAPPPGQVTIAPDASPAPD